MWVLLKNSPLLVRKIEWSHNGAGQFSNHRLEIFKGCFPASAAFPPPISNV